MSSIEREGQSQNKSKQREVRQQTDERGHCDGDDGQGGQEHRDVHAVDVPDRDLLLDAVDHLRENIVGGRFTNFLIRWRSPTQGCPETPGRGASL